MTGLRQHPEVGHFSFEKTALPEVQIISGRRFADARGHFAETFRADAFAAAGLDVHWVQDNESFSEARGTVRGLHYQAPPHAQAKLVRVVRGSIRDVAVDVRSGSPTYGQHVAVDISAEDGLQVLIPEGFLHGFATLEPGTLVLYKCSAVYAPEADGAVRFDDPDLAIDWGLAGNRPVLSDKDARAGAFADFVSPF